MYCQECGHEIPSGQRTCPSCGARSIPRRSSSLAAASFDQALADAKSAAKDLAKLTAKLSQRVAEKAGRAAKDPSSSARRGARRVASELDKAANEIERILRDL